MNVEQRQHYLKAMGIDLWVTRTTKKEAISTAVNPLENTWELLKQRVEKCTKCDLHKSRRQTVFGVGNIQSKIMIIGEAPGEQEDKRGEPFVGRAGNLLDAMLLSLGIQREQIYIANVLKCRPPKNRDPSPEEVEHCTAYLEEQIDFIKPAVLLAVGRVAAHYLLGVETPLSKLRGQKHVFGKNHIPLIVTYHPAYLLRNPKDKGKAYEDLLFLERNYLIDPISDQ